uniref:HYR domain-containing protein n=1 Tax=Nonlabens sp. TaxID=1888209 RepID=UPI003F6A262D
ISVNNDFGICGAVVTWTLPTASDNCDVDTFVSTHNSGDVFPVGTTTVVYTATDIYNNVSTTQFDVVVTDNELPVLDAVTLSDLIFNCEVTSLTPPTATDNCAGVVTGTTTYPITTTSVITWTYDDGNGNISTQDQLVIIERRSIDTIADVVVCDTFTLPAITGDYLTGGQMYYTQSGGNGIAFAEADILNFSDFASYPVTLYAYDVDAATGCSTETSFSLTINDTPVIGIINDISSCEQYELPVLPVGDYYTFPGGNGTLLNAGDVLTTTQTVFVYAEDASGTCSDETSFVVTITPTDIGNATFNDDTFTYDGSVYSLSVENIPSTATVVYTNNDQTEAGTYVVTATITSATASCSELVLTATMTIDRAPQTITFDPLQRRRLNVDPDFQLNASSSSGLPIDYSFSFTGANPAASVSPTGFVSLLAEGVILITASQPGSANYLPATAVEQPLEVYLGDNADLDTITIDGNVINNPGPDIYYLIECGSNVDSVDVVLENSDLATFDPAMTFTIATPRPGIYREQIIVTADNGTDTRVYNLTVERRFEFNDIVEQKYNNTLIVNNNFDNNGGYSFVAYEWYKNDVLVSTEQFFSEGDDASDLLDPTASYYVIMTTIDGDVLQTCVSTVELGNTYSLTVLENPVIEGRLLKVRADYPAGELDNATYELYSATGQFIMEVPVQGFDSEIYLSGSLPVGVYRLVLITSERVDSVNFIKN